MPWEADNSRTAVPCRDDLELFSARMTVEELMAQYEDLEREDILAALSFATRLSQIKRVEAVLA
jgi:uncharacterized protein (DUF433 family)